MNSRYNNDLLWKSFRRDIAVSVLGAVVIALPHHGVMGKWLGLGDIVGVLIALAGLLPGFHKLFVSSTWMQEGRTHCSLNRFRLIWVLVFTVAIGAFVL